MIPDTKDHELIGTDSPQTQVNLCSHIFTGSATLVGVCITVIGLIRVAINLGGGDTVADDAIFIASIAFMISCLLAYWGLHSHEITRLRKIERVADMFFLAGLLCLVLGCSLITYEMLPAGKAETSPATQIH